MDLDHVRDFWVVRSNCSLPGRTPAVLVKIVLGLQQNLYTAKKTSAHKLAAISRGRVVSLGR